MCPFPESGERLSTTEIIRTEDRKGLVSQKGAIRRDKASLRSYCHQFSSLRGSVRSDYYSQAIMNSFRDYELFLCFTYLLF